MIEEDPEGELVQIVRKKQERKAEICIDCRGIHTSSELIRTIKQSLQFPAFCGAGWDAVADLICDVILPQKIVFLYWDELETRLPKDTKYYTTLEEIVENEEYATPELIQDAIDCLTFCIDYCDTPKLCREHYINNRYIELGRVYMAAGEFAKAKECADKSLALEYTESADQLLRRASAKCFSE